MGWMASTKAPTAKTGTRKSAPRADPRPARTRARLVAATNRLITEKGVGALRIAEITAEAGVGMGSFYNHFSTKEELVEAVVGETLTSWAADIVEDEAPSDPAVVAMTAMRRFVRLAYDDVDFARLLVNLGHGEELFLDAITPFARTALERAVADGAFEIDDVELAVASVTGGGLSVIRRILDGHLGKDADADYARMVLRGFGVKANEVTRIVRGSGRAAAATGSRTR